MTNDSTNSFMVDACELAVYAMVEMQNLKYNGYIVFHHNSFPSDKNICDKLHFDSRGPQLRRWYIDVNEMDRAGLKTFYAKNEGRFQESNTVWGWAI